MSSYNVDDAFKEYDDTDDNNEESVFEDFDDSEFQSIDKGGGSLGGGFDELGSADSLFEPDEAYNKQFSNSSNYSNENDDTNIDTKRSGKVAIIGAIVGFIMIVVAVLLSSKLSIFNHKDDVYNMPSEEVQVRDEKQPNNTKNSMKQNTQQNNTQQTQQNSVQNSLPEDTVQDNVQNTVQDSVTSDYTGNTQDNNIASNSNQNNQQNSKDAVDSTENDTSSVIDLNSSNSDSTETKNSSEKAVVGSITMIPFEIGYYGEQSNQTESIFTVNKLVGYMQNTNSLKYCAQGTIKGLKGIYELEVGYDIANKLKEGNKFKVWYQTIKINGKMLVSDVSSFKK